MGTNADKWHSSQRSVGRRLVVPSFLQRWLKLPVAFTAAAAIVVLPVDTNRPAEVSAIETVDRVEPSALYVSESTAGDVVETSMASHRFVQRSGPEMVLDLGALSAEIAAEQTTTTEPQGWVEPEIEPESQWVDAGNGLQLPDLLLRIRFCESTNNYLAESAYSSARGAYQFLTKSWVWYGHADRYGVARAHMAEPVQQDEAALLTYQRDGARPWAESRPCWDDPNIVANYASARPPVTTTTTTTPESPGTTTSTTTGSEPTTTSEGDQTTTTPTTTQSTTTSTTTPPSTDPGSTTTTMNSPAS